MTTCDRHSVEMSKYETVLCHKIVPFDTDNFNQLMDAKALELTYGIEYPQHWYDMVDWGKVASLAMLVVAAVIGIFVT